MAMYSNGNSNQNTTGLVFAAGLLAGYVASLLIPEKAHEKAKEQIGESARRVKDVVMDEENLERVRSILPSGSIDIMDAYMEARENIMNELAQTKTSWDSLNKKKYADLVKKSLDSFMKDGKLQESDLKKLQKYLDNDFQTYHASQKAN